MNYAAILAGGTGTRVKSIKIPKQFVEIGGKPVIAYTINNVLKSAVFDKIYIAVHKDWIDFMNELVDSEFSEARNIIRVVYGGKERMDTITYVTATISMECGVKTNDVIVLHDAARPFVTKQILRDSVKAAAKYGAVVTAMSASDTMLVSESGEEVDNIPERKTIFHGQAPDSFRLRLFLDMLNALTEEQRANITGTSQICTLNGHKLHMIKGDPQNFKITTDIDLFIAEQMAIKAKG